MNRRNFLRSLIVGGVAIAAARTFPFRAFSFPKEIVSNAWRYYPAGTWPQMFGGEPSFLNRTVGPLSLHGLPYYIGDEDHPITSGVFYGIRRTKRLCLAVAEVIQNDLRDIKMLVEYSDRAAERLITCKSVDVGRKIITWESA
jgi:hypothetical protein